MTDETPKEPVDEPADEPAAQESGPTRVALIRDIAVFQVKLIIDGFRDLLLVPASLIAGLISLFGTRGEQGREFYDLLRLGRRSERYINLFGALEHAPESQNTFHEDSPEDIDRMVARVEDFVRDEYENGHLTGKAREGLENAVERLQKAARRES